MNREDFPMIRENLIYFDNAATTFKPKQVIDKINEYYNDYTANSHRGDYDIELKVNKEYELVREKVKTLINANNQKEIIFNSGTTEGINQIASGFFEKKLNQGDEIILSKSEHASNVMPWFRLALNNKVIIKYVELDQDLKVTMKNIEKIITSKTKLISLAHITNVIGDIRPLKEIIKLAHQNNILVVVDGAQSIPHIKVDVKDLDCDFLVFSSHKMLGPTGVGVLYGKYNLLNELQPIILGGGMNESFDNQNEMFYKDLPERLEAGTRNIAGVIGFGRAIDYLMEIGLDNIHQHELLLKKYLIDKLKKINHIKIINSHTQSGIVTFNIDGIFSQDVAIYLNKYKICVRSGNHCAKKLKEEIGTTNTVRISLYLYNTKEEIDRLIELLKNKSKILKEMI